MKRGQICLLKRGKKFSQVEVIEDHSCGITPFPAVTVKYKNEEWIVGVDELQTAESIAAKKLEEFLKSKHVPEMLEAITILGGAKNVREIADHMEVQMIDILSKLRKAVRMGVVVINSNNSITVTRKDTNHEKDQTSEGQSPESMPGMR